MPWVIRRKGNGGRINELEVDKRIYTQFVFSDAGPVREPRSPEGKGVSTVAVRTVLAALASRCGDSRLTCWPSIKRIAADTGMTTDTVMLALRAARKQGWVKWQDAPEKAGRRARGGRQPHKYRLLLPPLADCRAKRVMKRYVGHHWETRLNHKDIDRQHTTESDEASCD